MTKNTVKKRQNKSLILSKGKTPLLARKFEEGGSAALDWMNSSSKSAAQNAFSGANLGGTVSSIAGGIGGFVNSFNTAATIKDTSGIQANIDELANTDYSGATSWNQLSDMKSNTLMIDSVDGSDFTQSTGQQLGNMGSSALQGAALGAKIGGPWGALAGLVVGAGTSAVGWITGNAKAKREAERLNYEAKVADMKADNSFLDTFDDMKYQEMANNMANIVKDGGKIHIKPSKRGTFTAAAKRHGKSVQAFAAQVLANKDNYSPAMVKKANFARNFGGRKRANGGYLVGETYDVTPVEVMNLIAQGYEFEYL